MEVEFYKNYFPIQHNCQLHKYSLTERNVLQIGPVPFLKCLNFREIIVAYGYSSQSRNPYPTKSFNTINVVCSQVNLL